MFKYQWPGCDEPLRLNVVLLGQWTKKVSARYTGPGSDLLRTAPHRNHDMKAWTHGLVTLAVALSAGSAFADFDGPAPVAWRWAQPTTAAPGGKPLVSGDSVYVAVGGRIYALDRATGNQIWRFPAAEPLESNFRHGAAMGNGIIVAAADNKTIYAVDAATGALKWQHTSTETLTGGAVVTGNHVVIATMPSGVMSVDATTGQAEWKEPLKLKGAPYPNLAVWQDSVIVMTNEPSVVSVSPGAAKINWNVKASQLSGNSTPGILGDTIYINTGYYLTALRGASGAKKWDVRMDENLTFGPAVSETGVAVVSQTGTVFTFDLGGRFMFKSGVKLGSAPVSQPSFVGKLVSLGTENGSLNIIDPKSGEMVYNYVVPPLFRGAKISGGTGESTEVKSVAVAGAATTSGDTMLVLARDGSLLAFDKNLGVDLTAPAVTMIWPNPGDQVAGQPPLEIWFKIEDAASGVSPDSVRVKIGGTEYGGIYTKDGYLSVKISAIGANRPLSDGRAEIVVSASDWLGNHVDAKFVLSIDNTLTPIGGPPRKEDTTNTGGGGGRNAGRGG